MKNKNVSVVIVTRNRKNELLEAINSILSQTYRAKEIVVVDNASDEKTRKVLKAKKYKNIKLVRSEENLGGAGGRNFGLEHTSGEYILFMDDDAHADRNLIKELVKVFESRRKAGIIQPKIYEKNKDKVLQGVGHGINLKTGRVYGIGVHVKDEGQFENIRKIPMVGCTWMVKREVFDEIGIYDEDFFIPYEDSDYSLRVSKAGYKVLYAPKAKVWHQGPKDTSAHPRLQWLGITIPDRAYYTARNKIIFMTKHAKFFDLLFFLFILVPIYSLTHSIIILSTGRVDIFISYWKGIFSGLFYLIKKLYENVDSRLYHTKHFLLSLTDPVSWIIDKSSKTILDVACGQGMPMMVLKHRMKFDRIVGVDLYRPYIESCKRKKVHDEYYLSDVRKLKFKDKSFDVVLALQVVEHLKKKDALKVIEKLENIAKKQVIISTPIGKTQYKSGDENILQKHKSGFKPSEFKKMGYKTLKMGIKSLQGENGLVNTYESDLWKKIVYVFVLLISPFLYVFQDFADWYFIAYKKV